MSLKPNGTMLLKADVKASVPHSLLPLPFLLSLAPLEESNF